MHRQRIRQTLAELWHTARGMRRQWLWLVPVLLGWLLLFDAVALLRLWPDWHELSRGPVPRSRFIADYESTRQQQGSLPRLRWKPVPLSSLPEHVARAFIVSEDARFYRHDGVDLAAVEEAIEYNVERGRMAVGASTISQQTVKNLWLTPERSLLRKWHELLLTWRMERNLSKGRILSIYLNIVELGRGIYGVEAAAQHYFGRPASALSLAQAAALAATLPSPVKHNPKSATKAFQRRRDKLMRRLRQAGMLAVPSDRDEMPTADAPSDAHLAKEGATAPATLPPLGDEAEAGDTGAEGSMQPGAEVETQQPVLPASQEQVESPDEAAALPNEPPLAPTPEAPVGD